jgi:ribosome-associated protein
MLSALPPHKPDTEISAVEHRLAMLHLALDPHAGLAVGTQEIEREGVSYTIDTLRGLRQGPPPRDPLFILGTDSLLELHTWHEYRKLVTEFDLIVVERPGAGDRRVELELEPELAGRLVWLEPGDDGRVAELERHRPGAGGRIFRFPVQPLAVSSSDIRAQVTDGRDVGGLVPSAVAGYIRDNSLYRGEENPLNTDLTPVLIHCAEAAWDKKAENLIVLDLRGLSDVTDYFVICHGSSERQAKAIADSIEERLIKTQRLRPTSVEGRTRAEWILLDYIDFVVHVFQEEKRDFYRLERLWGDAPEVDVGRAEGPDRQLGPA